MWRVPCDVWPVTWEVAHRVLVRVERLHQRAHVRAVGGDLALHVVAVTHDGEDARRQQLHAVVRAVAPPGARRAAEAAAVHLLVARDRRLQNREQPAGVGTRQDLQRRPLGGATVGGGGVVWTVGVARLGARRRRLAAGGATRVATTRPDRLRAPAPRAAQLADPLEVRAHPAALLLARVAATGGATGRRRRRRRRRRRDGTRDGIRAAAVGAGVVGVELPRVVRAPDDAQVDDAVDGHQGGVVHLVVLLSEQVERETQKTGDLREEGELLEAPLGLRQLSLARLRHKHHPRSAVFQLGIFLRALRPVLAVLRPARFT